MRGAFARKNTTFFLQGGKDTAPKAEWQVNCPSCSHEPHKPGKCKKMTGNFDEPEFLHTRCRCDFSSAPSKRAVRAVGLFEAQCDANVTEMTVKGEG